MNTDKRMRTKQILLKPALALFIFTHMGCAFTAPYIGRGPHPQLTRGHPLPPIDLVGNVLALPAKVILWNWRFASHSVSESTEGYIVKYLDARAPALSELVIQLNEYAPHRDLQRLLHNRSVGWLHRILFGLPTTLVYDVLLPGRIIPWGDYYNPYTNTVHLFSDDQAIALHELGHAYDFSKQPHRGNYALFRQFLVSFLYQEWQATDEAIGYFIETNDPKNELRAYRVLYPAYGTYVGSLIFPPIGTVCGALVGHIWASTKVHEKETTYQSSLQPPSSHNTAE